MKNRDRQTGAKGGKGKGLNPSDHKCFLCGEEGYYKAQCTQRWYVPKNVFGSKWNSLPFLYGKGEGKANGKEESKEKGTGLGKSKNKGHSFGMYGPQTVNVLEGCNIDAKSA